MDLDAYIDTASAMVNDGELALAAVYTPPGIDEAGDA